MTVASPNAPRATPAASRPAPCDIDIRPRLTSPADLKPCLSQRCWACWLAYGLRRRHGHVKGHPYPKAHPVEGMRRDAFPPGGGMPGSDLDVMPARHLDRSGPTHGVRNALFRPDHVRRSAARRHAAPDARADR